MGNPILATVYTEVLLRRSVDSYPTQPPLGKGRS
jgi:hypothetical protein